MTECSKCGECCSYICLPIEQDHHDFYMWLRLHGLKIVEYKNQAHVRIEIPCKALKDNRCSVYKGRPSMCALTPCIKGEINDVE